MPDVGLGLAQKNLFDHAEDDRVDDGDGGVSVVV